MNEETGLIEAATQDIALPDGAWGAADTVTQDDFLISKALLMQALSDQVVNGDAKSGQLRDSLSGELLAEAEEPFEVLVFHRDMTWVVFEDGDFKEVIPLTPANRGLPHEDGKIERSKTFNFYLLPVKRMAEHPGTTVPMVLSLKRTGLRAAQTLQQFFHELRENDKPSASRVICLKSEKKVNKKGTFYVMTWDKGREATDGEMKLAYKWYKNVQMAIEKGTVKVDDSEEASQAKGKTRDRTMAADDSVPF